MKKLNERRAKQLLVLLNKAWDLVDPKPNYNDFNKVFHCSVSSWKKMLQLEKDNTQLGIVPRFKGMTTFSLIASITDVLCDKRLAGVIEDDGTLVGWDWYRHKKTIEKSLKGRK